MLSKIRNIVLLIAGVVILSFTNIRGSTNNLGVQQFNKSSYNAASQNWSVSSTENGLIYFANNKGLLEFDGSSWHLHQLPDQTVLRSVQVHSDSIIYSSGYQELGFWKRNNYGELEYKSLNEKAKQYFTKNIEFWNIISCQQGVYFHSFTGILLYQSDSVIKVSIEGNISAINNINGKILIAVKDKGIFELVGNKALPFIDDAFFQEKLVRFILPYKNNQILLGTEAEGIYVWNGKKFQQWKTEWKDYFMENELNRGHFSKKGNLILGTIKDGIVIFDKNENLIKKVNAAKGLSNNTVLGIDTDPLDNIWLALDDGISFIPYKSEQSFAIEQIPGIGAIYTSAILNDNMYLGTNQGLFVRGKDKVLKFIHGTQGQIWDCRIIEGKLWAGHNQGTFLVENDNAQKISNVSGGFSIKKDNLEETYIQSTYTRLVKFDKTEKGVIVPQIIDGFLDLVRYIEIDHLNNIWASHMHLGVFKIVTDDNREKTKEISYYGDNTFGQNHSIHVFKVENRIVFTSSKQLFTYDSLNDTILPYETYNEQLGKYAAAHRIISAPEHHYWFIEKNSLGLFKIIGDKIELLKEYPASLFIKTPLVDQYENIFPISDKRAILCLQNGIAILDASQQETTSQIANYKPVLRRFETQNNRRHTKILPLTKTEIRIKNSNNNLKVKISFPYITNLPLSHQYLLEGLQPGWSKKISEPEFVFERLPQGEYKLKIKTVDIWGNESQSLEIPFEILPPWYLSYPLLFSYFILLIIVLFGFRSWGIRQTKRKEQQQHEKREKELIKLRNEKLRNEIQHKSKELANSTMAIIKKNEFLLELKKSVEKQKLELGSRYPDKYFNHINKKIDKNISNRHDWQIFETNFERAHEQFIIKIKESYPELTSNDLRLCAYLRMNLLSKEIAPLLGISVRGVENHRYRLRKKMNLKHDESLTDTILGI